MNDEYERYRREQASAYLKRVRGAKRHIAALNAEVDELRAMAGGLRGIDYSRDQVSAPPSADGVPDAVVRILDVVEERVALVRDYASMLDECGRALAEMNGTYADVLRYRYLCDWRWEQIAPRLGYSEQWLYELHNQALTAFYDHMPAHEREPMHPAI